MCKGYCEGTGVVPVYMKCGDVSAGVLHIDDETDPELIYLWMVAEKKAPAWDGYHFVECPRCKGTGREP